MSQLCRISGWTVLFNAAKSRQVSRLGVRAYSATGNQGDSGSANGELEHDAGSEYSMPIPPYTPRSGETVELKRARLVYQSRKRGMLENGIILSTYASRYLSAMNEEQLNVYDKLINVPTNDWDIFDWIIQKKPVPAEFKSEIMTQLQEHAQNKEMEERFIQPPLY